MKPLFPTLVAAVLLAACTKDDVGPDGLVRPTQEGKNTGDFLLNGRAFNPLPRVSSPATKPVGANWYHTRKGSSQIQIFFFREERDANSTRHYFDIFIANVRKAGTYRLADLVSPFVIPGAQSSAQYETRGPEPTRAALYYLTGPSSPGRVVVTRFDTVAHVVSGTFEAKLRQYNGADSITITKGRFDCSF